MPETKQCPFCGEEILAVAIKCKHCASMLSGTPAPAMAQGTGTGQVNAPAWWAVSGPLVVGTEIREYRIEALLGEGGMGEVYRATDTNTGRPVAVKVVAPELMRDPGVRRRFMEEARVMAGLDHPNIVTLYSFFEEGGRFFLVMSYIDGMTLEEILKERRLDEDEACRVAYNVAAALHYAHTRPQPVIHRDIKPANIIISKNAKVVVTDFGVAKALGREKLTRTRGVVGTYEYMSPEQVRGEEVTAASDIYSLGITLYKMLTGVVPYPQKSDTGLECMNAHLHEPPPPLAEFREGLSLDMGAIVTRILAKDPGARYPNAERLRGDLKAVVTGEAPSKHSVDSCSKLGALRGPEGDVPRHMRPSGEEVHAKRDVEDFRRTLRPVRSYLVELRSRTRVWAKESWPESLILGFGLLFLTCFSGQYLCAQREHLVCDSFLESIKYGSAFLGFLSFGRLLASIGLVMSMLALVGRRGSSLPPLFMSAFVVALLLAEIVGVAEFDFYEVPLVWLFWPRWWEPSIGCLGIVELTGVILLLTGLQGHIRGGLARWPKVSLFIAGTLGSIVPTAWYLVQSSLELERSWIREAFLFSEQIVPFYEKLGASVLLVEPILSLSAPTFLLVWVVLRFAMGSRRTRFRGFERRGAVVFYWTIILLFAVKGMVHPLFTSRLNMFGPFLFGCHMFVQAVFFGMVLRWTARVVLLLLQRTPGGVE